MFKLTKVFFILIFLLNLLNYGLTAKSKHKNGNNTNGEYIDVDKQVLIIKHLGNCDESRNYTFYLPNFKVVQLRKNVYVMTGIIDIRDDFSNRKMKATIESRKCDVSFQSENCQSFIYWPIDDLCKFFNSDNSVYGIFLKNYTERPRCPLSRKSYLLNNVPINFELISILPTFGIQNYITYLKFYADKSLVGCFAIHSSIRTKRT